MREAQQQGAEVHDRYLELHYEDLTTDPETWLKSICNFLQVPYDPCIIKLSHVYKYSGSTDTVITKREEYWREYFSADKIDNLDKISGKVIHRLGYKTELPDGDEEPGLLRIKYWKYTDSIKFGFKVIRNEWKYRKNGGKWDDLSGKFINALRQRLTSRF